MSQDSVAGWYNRLRNLLAAERPLRADEATEVSDLVVLLNRNGQNDAAIAASVDGKRFVGTAFAARFK